MKTQKPSTDVLADPYLLEAEKAIENGHTQKAVEAFRKIEALNTEPPLELEYLFFLGKFLMKYDDSIEELSKGISLLKKFIVKIDKYSEHYKPALELLNSGEAKLLLLASSEGHTEIVKTLIDDGANINTKDIEGYTPLHMAVSSHQTETAIFLIEAGADFNIKNNIDGETAKYMAGIKSYSAIEKAIEMAEIKSCIKIMKAIEEVVKIR